MSGGEFEVMGIHMGIRASVTLGLRGWGVRISGGDFYE